ncbi:MAG: glucokinase [Burkholderiaceae bacterium]
MAQPTLLADIGGTNARFGLAMPVTHRVEQVTALRCADYPGPVEAAIDYLDKQGMRSGQLRYAAFAVATPTHGRVVHLTNSNWSIDRTQVEQKLGLSKLLLVNDFEALAMALPSLTPTDCHVVGGAQPQPALTQAVLGPGTGLGVAAVAQHEGRWVALPGEGGHVTLAAADDFEAAVIKAARAQFSHVSAERLLSGIGLPVLYAAVCSVHGVQAQALTAAQITERSASGSDAQCAAAMDAFFSLLGSFAGNAALTFGARGGVYIGGGIVPRMIDALEKSKFRQRFESKGRFEPYLKQVSTAVITAKYPALFGLANTMAQQLEMGKAQAPP